MAYNPKDFYFKKAKKENYAARSVFKLEEIDQKFKIFRPGQMIFDLGASPGSWSQYACQKIGDKGRLLGVDLSPVTVKMSNADFLQADMRDLNLENLLAEKNFHLFDVVMSDMAPRTTGIRLTDQARSYELCMLALDVADRFLKKGGSFICKFFHSDDFTQLREEIKKRYAKVEVVKPDSTRKISKEIFLVGLNKK